MSPPFTHRLPSILLTSSLILLLAACLSTPARPHPTPHASVSPPASSTALSISPDGARLAAVNPDSASITLVDARALRVIAEVRVGRDPRTVAFTPDSAFALVANHGSGTISIVEVAAARVVGEIPVGAQPYGIVAGLSEAQRAYVSLSALGQVAVVDLATRSVIRTVRVDPFPTGLALTGDESTLYVTHLYSGCVTPVDLTTFTPQPAISTGADANLSQFIALSPDGARAYLPQTRSNSDNLTLTYNTTVLPVVSVLDLAAAQKPVLPEKSGFATRLELDRADRPVNLPFAAAVSPDGQTLYVANAGSDDVSVVDLATGKATAHLEVGRSPRGLALSPDGARLFVDNTLDGTLSIFDLTQLLDHPISLSLTTLPLSPQLLTGKRLFNSALPPMSTGHWLSCASCHFDGGMDGRTWLGFPDGPRNTPALFGVRDTLPMHWSGDLDELQDVELTIHNIQHGDGLIPGGVFDSLGPSNAGRSPELDALAAYLASLDVPPSPYTYSDDVLQRGARAFQRWSCSACHTPPLYTDQHSHESSIGDVALEHNSHGRGMSMDTPSLLGAWATAPYFHDGSAPTLRDTLFRTGFHGMGFAMDRQEVEDLVEFMQALSYEAGK